MREVTYSLGFVEKTSKGNPTRPRVSQLAGTNTWVMIMCDKIYSKLNPKLSQFLGESDFATLSALMATWADGSLSIGVLDIVDLPVLKPF